MADRVLTGNLLEPLNGATSAKIDIDTGEGNLTIDRLTGGEGVLASGTLEYLEDQGLPTTNLDTSNDQATLTVKGSHAPRRWFHLPWEECNGATGWQIHLNPTIPSDITAHTDGGNVRVDLTEMAVTHLSVDTGGGNMDLVLPDNAANLAVIARTGAGNVTIDVGSGIRGTEIVEARSGAGNVVVQVPSGVPARVHVKSGLGKTLVDPQFSKIKGDTYQSPDYEVAADRIEITASSGAGSVNVITK